MKKRNTQKNTQNFFRFLFRKSTIIASAAIMVVAIPLQILQFSPSASADDYDSQIKTLQSQIDQYTNSASALREQADTLQNKINGLLRQQQIIQTQIDLANAQYEQLTQKIAETKKQINETKSALGDIVADLYIDGKVTSIEMIAGSKNISDYFDKQAQKESVSSSLDNKITQIQDLQKNLEKQQQEQKVVIQNNQNAKAALETSKQEQQRLLDETKGQEEAYNTLSNQAKTKQRQVQDSQQAAIQAAIQAAAASSGGGGGRGFTIAAGSTTYPWNDQNCYVDANAYSHNGSDGIGGDGWGYGCRQCASYAAWMVGQKTGKIPYGWGNANNFPASARSAGYQTGSTPRGNALGVMSAGAFGHIVYVESVNGNGSVNISQYNYYYPQGGGTGWGHFTRMTVPAGTYDTYIYL